MAYATVEDVQARMIRTMSLTEQAVCTALLDDAAVVIDAYKAGATADAKKVVSCRIVIRALGDGAENSIPIGATQGSMSGLGYSQSWSIGSAGAAGEIYLGRQDKIILGGGDLIGSHSPLEDITGAVTA